MAMPQQPDDAAARFTMKCLRGRFDPDALDTARELASGSDFDWAVWFDAVRAEALAPLLYHILSGRAIVPAAIEEGLQVAYFESARDNALRFRELGRVLRRLAAADVQVVLLKGAALAETVYHDIAARPMGDLDLLVQREAVIPALGLLAELGYTATHAEAFAGVTLDFENEVQLLKPGPVDTLIEIHWSLLNSPHYQHKLPMAWFWATATPVEVEGNTALALGPEALLLHLCAHLALHHDSTGARWLHDVAEIVYGFRDRLDWEEVLTRAQMWDLVLPVQQVLGRVALDWQAPIPDGIQQRLSTLQPSADETRVNAWLTAPARPVAQRFWADLASMPDWRDRLRYGWSSLFPSASYMCQRYGISHRLLLPLAYPYRWLLGMRGALSALARRTRDVRLILLAFFP
jgi:hypothetical protein